jgi:hypothetical protein
MVGMIGVIAVAAAVVVAPADGLLGMVAAAAAALMILALFPGTSPSGSLVDVSDRAGRLLGSVLLAGGAQQVSSVTNPAQNTIFGDTGPLPAGTYRITLAAFTSALTSPGNNFQLQHRNGANAANIDAVDVGFVANAPTYITVIAVLAANERFRFGNFVAAFTGNASGVLSFERLL